MCTRINYANFDHIVAQDGLKGALGSKKTEADKSATVPVGDGPLPPTKLVSPNQLTVPFVLPLYSPNLFCKFSL